MKVKSGWMGKMISFFFFFLFVKQDFCSSLGNTFLHVLKFQLFLLQMFDLCFNKKKKKDKTCNTLKISVKQLF